MFLYFYIGDPAACPRALLAARQPEAAYGALFGQAYWKELPTSW